MSLWAIKTVTNPIEYDPCPGPAGVWGAEGLCEGGNDYRERFSIPYFNYGNHFFYFEPYDVYLLFHVMDDAYANWRYRRYVLNADDGSRNRALEAALGGIQVFLNIWQVIATKNLETGSYQKVYGTSQFLAGAGTVFEVNPSTALPQEGGWSLDFDLLPEFPSAWWLTAPQCSIVNREDGYLALFSQGEARFWGSINTTPSYLGRLKLPSSTLYDVAYENRRSCWVSCGGGFVGKIDYQNLRWEVYSKVQDAKETDRKSLLAWDILRGRLGVLRIGPDEEDGAANNRLEFYRPIPKIASLSDPVPLRPLRAHTRIPFSVQLLGDAGEGISPYLVQVELDDPAAGTLTTGSLRTEIGGEARGEHLAPAEPDADTIRASVTFTDGEEP